MIFGRIFVIFRTPNLAFLMNGSSEMPIFDFHALSEKYYKKMDPGANLAPF